MSRRVLVVILGLSVLPSFAVVTPRVFWTEVLCSIGELSLREEHHAAEISTNPDSVAQSTGPRARFLRILILIFKQYERVSLLAHQHRSKITMLLSARRPLPAPSNLPTKPPGIQ